MMRSSSPSQSISNAKHPGAHSPRLRFGLVPAARIANLTPAVAAILLVSSFGCVAARPPATPLPLSQPNKAAVNAAPQSSHKRDAIVRDFEQRRDTAQLGAALDRWKQGDSAAAQELLEQLLRRNPNHVEGRRALADLCAARPDPAAATEHLLYLIERHPDDAQAHHSLGLAFESLHRQAEAATHFERAVTLEPANELYQLSLEGCREESPRS